MHDLITRRNILHCAVAGALLPLLPRQVSARVQPPATASPGLGVIRAVTLTAPDLAVVQTAWTRFMDYRVVSRGRLARSTAVGWDAPALTGRPYLILGPASGERTYLRFVEQPREAGGDAAATPGWRTVEITVQDTDALYARLKDSPFVVARPPATIPTYSYLRAMQATGPAGEKLNLTCITEPRPDLAAAKSFVGRCFITVLGAPNLPAQLEYYRTTFGNAASPIRQLPSLQLAVITLADGAKIEVDQLGPEARPGRRPPGGLPPGVALVTFDCARFGDLRHQFLAPPARNAMEPLRGSQTGTLRGPAGELIELLSG